MGLFDLFDDEFGIIDRKRTPSWGFDPFHEMKKDFQKKTREVVDSYIHPDSDLGQIIKKGRKMADREEEKRENRERAPENLFHYGEKKQTFKEADHLFIRCGIYTHHAIFVGGNSVIHYSDIPDGKIHVQLATLEQFAQGKEIRCLSESESPLTYTREQAVRRAYHRINEKRYHLLDNNCEAFVRWCRSGGDESVWQDD